MISSIGVGPERRRAISARTGGSRRNPPHWVIFEVYRDLEAFEAHIGSEHGRVFNKALAGIIEGQGSELTWLREPSF